MKEKETNIINENLSFFSKQKNYSISKYSECLKKYALNFDKEISLKTKSKIFLDTNILLRYYSISFTARKKLFQFIKKNKNRIIITNQVQYEFIKNRESTIQKFIEQVSNKIPKDFKSDIINKMKSFLEINKIVLKDYPFIEKGIEKHQKELEELLEKLNKSSSDKKEEYLEDLVYNDKFLDLICSCEFSETLTIEETKNVKEHFDKLRKSISDEKIDNIINNKIEKIFPGLGDISKKPKDPYGDYIIFHEIMKHLAINKADAIFLTFDNTKGDWMSKSRNPYIHYVQNMFSNTNQILYIVDAERTLKDILKVDIQSLVSINSKYSNEEFTNISLYNLIGQASKRFNDLKMYIPKSLKTLPDIETKPRTFFKALLEIFSNIYNHSINGSVRVRVKNKESYIKIRFENTYQSNINENVNGKGIGIIQDLLEECLVDIMIYERDDLFIVELNIPKQNVPNNLYN